MNSDFSSIPIKDLEAYLRKANEEYRKGTPFISDELYDALYDNLKSRDPENDFFKSKEFMSEFGAISIDKEKRTLPYPLFSLDKIKNDEKQLESWKDKFGSETTEVVVSEKLDGNSALLVIKSEEQSSTFGLKPKKSSKEPNLRSIPKLNYELYTRGNGFVGQVITHLVPYLRNIPTSLGGIEELNSLVLRGELILSKADWPKVKAINPELTNPRNAVAGIINAKEPNLEIAKYIQFVAYEVIEPINLKPEQQFKLLSDLREKNLERERSSIPEIGKSLKSDKSLNDKETKSLKSANYKVLSDPSIEDLSAYLTERRANSEFEVDGIVVSSNAVYPRPTEDNPKYAFAFKSVLTQEKAEVVVTGVTWAVSKDGIMNPLVHFPTVNLNGVNISKATGKSAKFIVDNVIGAGSVIVIIRAGDVIPDIVEILKPSSKREPSLPTTEDLGNDLGDTSNYEGIIFWNKNRVDLEVDIDVLKSKYGMKSKLYREILIKQYTHFFNTIDVDGVSEGLIVRLFNAGKTSLKDLLTMSVEDILESDAEGIKEKSAIKIVTAIQNALTKLLSPTNNVIDIMNSIVTLMTASGCFGSGFGNRRFKALIKAIPKIANLNAESTPSYNEVVAVDGFAETTALQFLDGYVKFLKFIDENGFGVLRTLGAKVSKIENSKVLGPKVLSGTESSKVLNEVLKNVVFSGFRSEELENLIESSGGKVGSAVTKKTSLLIIKSTEPEYLRGKYEKAKELGVRIMTLPEFKNKVSGH